MDDEKVVRTWLMICPRSGRGKDGKAKPPTDKHVKYELNRPQRVEELRSRLSNPSWLMRQLTQYMGIRCNAEDEMRGHFWESRFGMRRLLDEEAVLACLAYVDLNPHRAEMVEGLEDYPHVSIAERLRTLDDQEIDTDAWLAPIELASEADREPVKVVNHMTREQIDDLVAERQTAPLGCLPMTLVDYVDLLRWLVDKTIKDDANDTRAPEILRRMNLDAMAFRQLVKQFGKRFSTCAGNSKSMAAEAKRRGHHRPHRRIQNALDPIRDG